MCVWETITTLNFRYKAWSSIVVSLIPNVSALKMHLQSFASIMDADEVVLFERATFLVISHAYEESARARDPHRFEKISNIIKQFKLSCRYVRSSIFADVPLWCALFLG